MALICVVPPKTSPSEPSHESSSSISSISEVDKNGSGGDDYQPSHLDPFDSFAKLKTASPTGTDVVASDLLLALI